MSRIAQLEEQIRKVRFAISKAVSMQEALTWERPASFSVEATVRGHFASSPTYNQTEAPELNVALAEGLKESLAAVLPVAVTRLRAQEKQLINELLREAASFCTEVGG